MLANLFGLAACLNIAEDEHDSTDLTGVIENRRSAVIDRGLSAVWLNQHRVIGQTHDPPVSNYFFDWAFYKFAGFFINNMKNFIERLVHRFGSRPAAKRRSDWIHKCHATVCIGNDDRIANASDGDTPILLLFFQPVFKFFALRYIPEIGDKRVDDRIMQVVVEPTFDPPPGAVFMFCASVDRREPGRLLNHFLETTPDVIQIVWMYQIEAILANKLFRRVPKDVCNCRRYVLNLPVLVS